jgi:tetratricopeptide (TPR) repeat protein
MTGEFELAISCYEQIVEKEPSDCESWNNLGNAYRSSGKLANALPALRRAVQLDADSAPIRLNFATALMAAGDDGQAETELRKMAEDFAEDPNPLRHLHTLLKEQGREEEALQAIREAVDRAADDLNLQLGLASYLSHMVDLTSAEAIYRRVLDLDNRNAIAWLGVAVCLDLSNRTRELSEFVSQAEGSDVEPDALNFMRAIDCRRTKKFAEGLAALDRVPEQMEPVRRAHVRGQLLEGVGRYDEAFESFKLMNELLIEEGGPPEERAATYRQVLRERIDAVTPEWVARWRPETEKDPRPTPVFLVGFPRSGTTLLDTMLMGHPQIEVLEEEPTLHKAFDIFQDYDEMPVASDEQIQAARDAYFEAAAELTPLKPGNLLVDKNPLAMNAVPFIRRLFPDVRIIVAVRHPLDVVLSCYVTNFKLNAGIANFVQLDTAAELYDLSFRYLERVLDLMPTPTHNVVYENVVANRDRELRALFDFLGLDWHDAVLDHQSTALNRGRIKTASYAQVVEPIYKRSAGRWQNYRKHLEPIIPVLRPWIDKFGYEV